MPVRIERAGFERNAGSIDITIGANDGTHVSRQRLLVQGGTVFYVKRHHPGDGLDPAEFSLKFLRVILDQVPRMFLDPVNHLFFAGLICRSDHTGGDGSFHGAAELSKKIHAL
jgi:hypothetical protein